MHKEVSYSHPPRCQTYQGLVVAVSGQVFHGLQHLHASDYGAEDGVFVVQVARGPECDKAAQGQGS